jgi:hypothetical protein
MASLIACGVRNLWCDEDSLGMGQLSFKVLLQRDEG